MSLSKCCKAPIYVEQTNEGTGYYVCHQCHFACDFYRPELEHKEPNEHKEPIQFQ